MRAASFGVSRLETDPHHRGVAHRLHGEVVAQPVDQGLVGIVRRCRIVDRFLDRFLDLLLDPERLLVRSLVEFLAGVVERLIDRLLRRGQV